ncbi:MAG TPA: isopeptide-forming domain-containing fimbrial protein [Candidatus Eremiobacteraceae bacterium]|nr:isopeptide-forming domain-containing fimbrial protein [Candidatus Eremiobacteraceae bacterium]
MLRSLVLVLAAAGAGWVAMATQPALAATPAGTIISNTASATYADSSGTSYATDSNTVVAQVQAVASLTVTPKETAVNPALDSYAVGNPVTRRFIITNTSNLTDAYTIQAASTTKGAITSISFVVPPSGPTIPVTVGSTVSPSVVPGGTMFVDVTVNTTGVPVGTSWYINLTAQTTVTGTANGLQSDTGQRWAIAVPGPNLSGVKKLVGGEPSIQAAPSSTVTFTISFTNSGGLPANNVVMTDVVPTGLHPILSSVLINGVPAGAQATLAGQTLTVTIPTVAAAQAITIQFQATVDPAAALGSTYVNTAQVSATGVGPFSSPPASVFVGTGNIVYDGLAGPAHPIASALLTITSSSGITPITLTGTGVAPNNPNANPYTTGGPGTYSFGFGPGQFGGAPGDSHYHLTITAAGYLNRQLDVMLHADPTGTLYTATIKALDGQQLAVPGGFTLTPGPVVLTDVFNILGNIPMFTAHPIQIAKTVDQQAVITGSRVIFAVAFSNASLATLTNATLVDTLPPGIAYGPGTALVDGVHQEPVVNGRTLTWTFGTLAPGASHTVVYAGLVLPQAVVNSTLTNVATLNAFAAGTDLAASAEASVYILSGGAFSYTIPITGRVFVDPGGLGTFVPGDQGVPNVRLYLEDGEYVVTDANGRYSFPAARPGMHVIRLDTTTLPAGVRPSPDALNIESPRSTTRLVHGILDTGLLQDINFALQVAK